MSDLVADWTIIIKGGTYRIQFEHGSTSGKRVIRINEKEILRKNWLFKLVGCEYFTVGKTKCCINIEAIEGFAYRYSMEVNGKKLEKFVENQSKILQIWEFLSGQNDNYKIILEKDTLDVYVNGIKVDTNGQFTYDGVETHFSIDGTYQSFIKAINSGKRKTGILYKLYVEGNEIPIHTNIDTY